MLGVTQRVSCHMIACVTYYHLTFNTSHVCHVSPNTSHVTCQVSTIVFFLAPMTAITVLYALIGVAILRSTHLSRAGSDTPDPLSTPLRSSSPLVKGHGQGHEIQGQGHQWTPYHQQRRGGVLKMLG